MPARTRTYRLILIGFSALLALAVAEVGLRYHYTLPGERPQDLALELARSERLPLAAADARFSLLGLVRASADRDVVYELKPNLTGTFRGQPVHTNSFGLRGHETTLAKPPGTFRIAGLGDSNMFGWGVAQGEEYLALLEGRLNRAGSAAPQGQEKEHAAGQRAGAPRENSPAARRFEVLNFAVPGYNGWMEAATFERRAAAFSPDLVILHFVGNDFDLPHFMQPPESLRGRSFLVDFFRTRFGREPEPEEGELLPHDIADLPAEARRQTRDQYAYMTGVDHYLEAMARLGRLTRERRIPVVVMTLGDDTEGGRICRRAAAANGFLFLSAAPRFFEYMVAHGISADRHGNWAKTFRFPHDGHPNALAHSLYAGVLFDQLVRMGVVRATLAQASTGAGGSALAPRR
jgi:hypothetical protein